MTAEGRGGGMEKFPVGLRVLAVDDDPVCLRMLEALLQRCQYNVTTTNQAITALKILRENRDRFDLVISDVHMPDMDGFKLLELVGLEMDLPVIMMSVNGDPQNVMKGITHGACDYLIKPVRLEELKNIWQHVIRRKKFDDKHHGVMAEGEDDQKAKKANDESNHGATDDENPNKKRKEQDEEEDDHEDGGSQKKPRVVWTIDLHRKFVNAVNQLGIDKAVPKKILDHMNVENLTRENVASHLQKYRLYLKRISTVSSQGGRSTYANLNAFSGYGNYQALGGSRQLPALTSFQSHGVLGRMNNNPPHLGNRGSMPSQPVQFCDMLRNASNSFSDFRKIQSINLSGNHQGTLLPRVPIGLDSSRLQQSKTVQEVKSQISPGLSGGGVASGLSRGVSYNPLMLRPDKLLDQSGGLTNISSARMSSSDPFAAGAEEFSQLSNLTKYDNTWPGTATPTDLSSNPLSMLGHLSSNHFPHGKNINNISSITLNDHNSLVGDPLCGMASAPQRDPAMSKQCLARSVLTLDKDVDEKDQFPNLTTLDNSTPKWDDTFHLDHISRTSSSSSFTDVKITDTAAEYQISGSDLIGQGSFDAMAFIGNCAVDDDIQLNYRDEFPFECSRWKNDLNTSDCSLDDLVNSMIKQEQNDSKQMDADLGSDEHNRDDEGSERGNGDGNGS